MKHSWKHILSLLLAAAMLFALVCPALADNEDAEAPSGQYTVTLEKIDAQPRGLGAPTFELAEEKEPYGPNDNVRVSIVLEQAPAIKAGFSKRNIGSNASVQSYRDSLRLVQDSVAQKISTDVLGGAKLDVVWNLTLAANIISANVPYGKIEAIKAVPGVKDVIVEMQYNPTESVNMSNASAMVGTTQVWANEYTGAGSIVAIIDTGLDTDHELFDPYAFVYAIDQTGKNVDLLDADDVARVWNDLHASDFIRSADSAYLNSKVPFAVNYVDGDTDVTHENDIQGEHGSHVAGIAAANRYVKRGEEYVSSLEAVYTQGEAPDAQVLVMKVFGKGGGAYDSDYMAAIEDAIVLGADAVNLSLGSAVAGYVMSDGYQDIMDGLAETETVVSISAGNAYEWPYFSYYGYLYSDGVNYDTVGSPGSFANALTVASVNNDGQTGIYFSAYGNNVFYSETSDYGNEPITTIAGEHEFVYVNSPGVDDNEHVGQEGDDFATIGRENLEGKIAICNRGDSSFFAKANAAVAQGAIAVIIANNQPGVINMNLTGYEYEAPAVSITQADGAMLRANAETDSFNGVEVYVGTLTIESAVNTISYGEHYYTMSDFSSWGVPGDLSLKPEITAPGGNIWSLNGYHYDRQSSSYAGGHDQYENMSGTSMASPQIAGVTALMAQYIRENDLARQTGLTPRQLINSLLMSTAKPLVEEDSGNYYSVMKQGAGLVNADAAISADSYILMDDYATASAGDGKVKVELGDDPGRTGVYSFSFNINNLTDEDLKYDVRADFFTQDLFYSGILMDTWTAPLDAEVTWTSNGQELTSDLDFDGDEDYDDDDVQALLDYIVGTRSEEEINLEGADFDGDDEYTTYDAYLALLYVGGASVNVPASGSVTVSVTVKLNDIDDYDVNGAYVEGYVFATERTTAEGVLGTEHSIPVLGYYGSWSEPTMHDVGSYLEYAAGTEDRPPYMYAEDALGAASLYVEGFGVKYGWDDGTYMLGGNPYEFDEVYIPERDSIPSDSTIVGVNYSLIRNSAGSRFTATIGGSSEEIKTMRKQYAAYYDQEDAQWYNTSTSTKLNYSLKNAREGDKVELEFLLASEYYLTDDGINWAAIDPDSAISFSAVIDNTAPEVKNVDIDQTEEEINSVSIEVKENRYVAALLVWNEEGWTENGTPILETVGDPDEVIGAGRTVTLVNGTEEGQVDFSDKNNLHLLVEVYDYAANVSTYKINLTKDELQGGPTSVTITPDTLDIFVGETYRLTADVEPWGIGDEVKWKSEDPRVATVDENGVVTGVSEGRTTIHAFSALDDRVSGEARITVANLPDYDLNAMLWDEEGYVHLIEFNTRTLASSGNYDILAENVGLPIIDMTWDLYGETIYMSDMDVSGEYPTSTLYALNPETFTLSSVGSDPDYAFVGMAPSVAFAAGEGYQYDLLTVYGTAILCIDSTIGQSFGGFDLSRYFDIAGDDFVGIGYIGSNPLTNYGLYCDYYVLIDNQSNLYMFNLIYSDGTYYEESYYFDLVQIGSFRAPIGDMWYFNSLYVNDDGMIFWSRYDGGDYVDIYMNGITDINYDDYPFIGVSLGSNIYVGSFDEDVWPVAGLIELGLEDSDGTGSLVSKADGEISKELLDKLIPAKFATDIKPVFAESKASSGKLNAVSVVPDSPKSVVVEPNEPVIPNPAGDYTVTVTADELNHNGLFRVKYETDELEFVSAESPIEAYSAINDDEENGEVIFGYATRDSVFEDDDVLYLHFRMIGDAPSEIEVTTEELNDDVELEDATETVTVGEYEYDGPEWIFSDDYSSAVAVFTAKSDPTVVESIDAEVESETTPAQLFKPGKTVYTYTVEFKGVTYTTTVVVVIPALTPDPPTPPAPDPEEEIGDEGTPLGDDTPFPFEDVYEDDWYYDAVYEMYKAGYIKGTSETTYEPNEDISRAQIVTILYRIDGERSVESGEPFTDVDVGAWYFDAVCWAYAKGIVKGISETEFDPDTAVTREQFAAIIYRYAQFRGDAVRPTGVTLDGYSDGGSVSDWAKEAMSWCVANKLIQGTGENALDPQSNATRGQAAVIFSRMIKLFE